jgi:hypothetical protein
MTTLYRPIPGRQDAYAGLDGTIVYRGEVLEPYGMNKTGHLWVRPLGWVHHLVLLAFRGPCPPGYERCHQDGNPSNNALGNLSYGTRRDNVLDAIRHGTHYSSSRTECPHGHAYTPENTYQRPSRRNRECRTCRHDRRKR